MFKSILPIILIALLSACAQVGVLSGGGRDTRAPILLKSTPEHATAQVNPTKLVLRFDEFIELVNPTETFRLEPADAKLSISLLKKEVVVILNGSLMKNTTYSLCIDGGIKDVAEGNDSVYRVAFSTGSTLDSLRQFYRVGDAYTKKAMEGVSIGLFATDSSQRARYLTKSNREGWATLDFLPKDSFYLKAFTDLNKNGMLEYFEPQEQFFLPFTPKNDSLAFLLSIPRETKRSYAFKIKAPGLLLGHLPQEIELKELRVNGKEPKYKRIDRDSIMIALNLEEAGPVSLTTPFDTLNFVYTEKDRSTPLKGEINQPVFGNPIRVQWNGFLLPLIDPSKIRAVKQDSTSVLFDSIVANNNTLFLYSRYWPKGKLKLILEPEALQASTGQKNVRQTLEANYLGIEDLGVLQVRFPYALNGQRVILEREGKVAQSIYYPKGTIQTEAIYRNLLPGDYQIVVVDDLNGNGFWDPYRPNTKEVAEPIRRYTKVPKVRANWEIEVDLE